MPIGKVGQKTANTAFRQPKIRISVTCVLVMYDYLREHCSGGENGWECGQFGALITREEHANAAGIPRGDLERIDIGHLGDAFFVNALRTTDCNVQQHTVTRQGRSISSAHL